jgi:hypothetical protein
MNPLYKVTDDRGGEGQRRTITSLRTSSALTPGGGEKELKIEL